MCGLLFVVFLAAPSTPTPEALFARREYRQAAQAYDQRFARHGRVDDLAGAALSWTGAGEVERARERWTRVRDRGPRSPLGVRAHKALARIDARYFGALRLQCTPSGARAQVTAPGGEVIAQGPCNGPPLSLRAGRYQLRVHAPGFQTDDLSVLVPPGGPVRQLVTLPRAATGLSAERMAARQRQR
jgi:hypothetical protein